MGQRSNDSDAEQQTRAYLLADAKGFRLQMCSTLAEDPSWSREAWRQLSPRVDALANGDAVPAVHGWELPEGHWARVLGMHRDWTLGADNVLRPFRAKDANA